VFVSQLIFLCLFTVYCVYFGDTFSGIVNQSSCALDLICWHSANIIGVKYMMGKIIESLMMCLMCRLSYDQENLGTDCRKSTKLILQCVLINVRFMFHFSCAYSLYQLLNNFLSSYGKKLSIICNSHRAKNLHMSFICSDYIALCATSFMQNL
jgi:hypothetical protein